MALTVPTDGRPSNPMHRMWAWGLAGSLLPLSLVVGPLMLSLGMVAGMAVGYYTGDQKRQKELETGMRTVREPSYINGGLAKGWIWGGALGTLAGMAVGAAVLFATGGIAAVAAAWAVAAGSAAVASPAYISAAVIGGMVTSAVITVTKAVQGSIRRKAEMEYDYARAERYHEVLALENEKGWEHSRQEVVSQKPQQTHEAQASSSAEETVSSSPPKNPMAKYQQEKTVSSTAATPFAQDDDFVREREFPTTRNAPVKEEKSPMEKYLKEDQVSRDQQAWGERIRDTQKQHEDREFER